MVGFSTYMINTWMKVYEILEASLLNKSNQVDTHEEEKSTNTEKAVRLANAAKQKSKKNNPQETETPTGWRADPHQGGHVRSFINR